MDVDDIAKVLDSKLLEKAYEEAASPAVRQIGYLCEDTAKAFRLFTAPLQLLATGQDRFENWLDKVRQSVPRERQREAPPEIAGPVLMNLRFANEKNNLHHLYLNLLKAAIDTEHYSKAHPGFIKAIEYMTPKEAKLLQIIYETAPFQWVIHQPDVHPRPLSRSLCTRVSHLEEWSEDDIQSGLEVLSGLTLIGYSEKDIRNNPNERISFQSINLWLTEYGSQFIKVCMPDGFPNNKA